MISNLRDSITDGIGVRAIHAVEDGLTVGITVGLALTYPTLAAILLVSLGCIPKRAGPLAIIREVTDLVREEDARAQESYFVISVLIGVGLGVASGTLLSGVVTVPVDVGTLIGR